ncbi:MAG: Flp pilus assembly complex ATPase component TadA [Granulosicoccus sp.]|nr:Flp pilus assembly complex ATPase component TadA [Granulosicoccus sp.]
MFNFYYQTDKQRRRMYQVQGSTCTIGSSDDNELTIHTPGLAKHHAELRQDVNGIVLHDLGSVNGCWVNRELVTISGPLTELDEISIGNVRIQLCTHDTPANQAMSKAQPSAIRYQNQQGSVDGPTLDRAEQLQDSNDSNDQFPDQNFTRWGSVVHEQLLQQMHLRRKDVNRMSDEELREESKEIIREIVDSLDGQLGSEIKRDALELHVLNESVGLGPLELFLADESINEIMVNNHREIFIEKHGVLEKSPLQFSSDATVTAIIDRIITPLGKRIDESSPIVDARLKDGSRVNAVIPPLALKGPSLTIRKFPSHQMDVQDLVASGTLNQSMLDFLRICVEQRKNIVVSGGTGSGKTTLLNILSRFIPQSDRVVTIEDAAELKLVQPNLVSLESRPANLDGRGEVPIRDLVRNALRMRPDRIVVGECRGAEALDMLQAMNTGHDGSLTTLHANSPRDVLSRLEVMVLMSGMDLPVKAIREQVCSAVDIIVQQHRFASGSRKITCITEVVGLEGDTVQLQDIFKFEQHRIDETANSGRFIATGAIPGFYEYLQVNGVAVDMSCFQSSLTG